MSETDDAEELDRHLCELVTCVKSQCGTCGARHGHVIICGSCKATTCQTCISTLTPLKQHPTRGTTMWFTCPQCDHRMSMVWREDKAD